MRLLHIMASNAAFFVSGLALVVPLIVSSASAGEPISLDELNQRASLTTIKPVMVDGKRLVSERHRVEEVANQLCEQFGGRLKSLQLDFERPVGKDETVSYHDGIQLQQHRLGYADQFTAFESVVCVGLVLRSADSASTLESNP